MRPRRFRIKGFGLLEVILVFAIVIGAAAIVFNVFSSSQSSSAASNEADYVRSSMANGMATFTGNPPSFRNAQQWWNQAMTDKKPWTISPNGYSWGLNGTDGTGTACGTDACPTLMMIFYYRDDPTMSEDVCVKLMSALTREYFVNPGNMVAIKSGVKPKPATPATLSQYCNRSSGVAPLYFSVTKPF